VRLEIILALQRLAEGDVVVDFTVDGEDDGAVLAHEGLRAGVYWSVPKLCRNGAACDCDWR
jgi:hypothetical protein